MNKKPPTLRDLRTRELRGPEAAIGNWPARRFARPLAIYGTWLAVRLGLSAHQVTLLALGASIAASVAIGAGGRWGFAAGAGLVVLAFWLDRVDGQVARWRGTAGLSGVYLDYLMHHAATLAVGFSLGFGLTTRTGQTHWAAAGFLTAVGWTFLSIHNDCRYKAFFQPLKRARGSFRVDGGHSHARLRPSPSTDAPFSRPDTSTPAWRRGVWWVYRLCEPHVVMMTLICLGILGMVAPELWEPLWMGYVLGMAGLAPLLAIARAGRAVVRETVAAEFNQWFRPWEDDPECAAAPVESATRDA